MRLVFAILTAFADAAVADPACLARTSSLRDQAVSDAQVTLCFEGPSACWAFDLAAKTWAPAAKLPDVARVPPTPASMVSETLTLNIKACKAGKDCKRIDVPDLAATDSQTVIATADRSLVALYGPRGPASIFDGKTEKLLAQIKPWKTLMGSGIASVLFLGRTVLVLENHSPVTSAGRLFTPKGVSLGDAGPGSGLTGDVFEVAADEWAFPTLETARVYIVNARTGKQVARIDSVPGSAGGQSGVAIVHRTADAKTLVIASGDPASGVVLYDIAKHAQKRYPPPVCK